MAKYGLNVARIHTHIGSGSDPVVWQGVAGTLDLWWEADSCQCIQNQNQLIRLRRQPVGERNVRRLFDCASTFVECMACNPTLDTAPLS